MMFIATRIAPRWSACFKISCQRACLSSTFAHSVMTQTTAIAESKIPSIRREAGAKCSCTPRPKLPAPVQRYTATADTRSSHSWKRHPKAWLHLAEACSRSLGLPLARKRCPRRDKLLLLCRIDLRVAQVEILDRFHDRGGDYEPGEPLVVRGHDEPGCSRRRGGADCFLEGVHIVAPEASLADVGGRELPVLLRPLQALHEAPLLLRARDVQKELEDDRPLPGEVILEMRDVGEPLIPDFFANVRRGQPLASENLGVHAHDQDLFVVRTVEDADAPALG